MLLSYIFKVVLAYAYKIAAFLKASKKLIYHQFKKDDAHVTKNYRPISFLPSMSKIDERLMENQVKPYANTLLNPLFCGFLEGYNSQHALLRFAENCKNALDNKMSTGAIFVDLSIAFDCVNHKLLSVKLEAYGFKKKLEILYITS